MDRIEEFILFVEKHRLLRKAALLWIIWLITWTVMTALGLPDINGSVASIVATVVGIFSIVLTSLVKGDKEGSDGMD